MYCTRGGIGDGDKGPKYRELARGQAAPRPPEEEAGAAAAPRGFKGSKARAPPRHVKWYACSQLVTTTLILVLIIAMEALFAAQMPS